MQPKVVVVGSANTDFVVRVPELPSRGETVLGGQFQIAGGGKGANQAVAAARLGALVTFVARVGGDSLGREAMEAYQEEGIDTRYIQLDKSQPSGVALILVNQQGENMIAVAPGANRRLSPEDVLAAEPAIRDANCLLVQLEVPLETVFAAAELARRHAVRVILNPAPAQRLPQEIFPHVDILTPNETEAAILLGKKEFIDDEALIRQLHAETHVPGLIVTLGSRGAALLTGEVYTHIPTFHVSPVDTTACGDAFNGALAVSLGRGESLVEAVRFANAAGALAATRAGAQPSLPTEQELVGFLASV